jgi:hypothetical protein
MDVSDEGLERAIPSIIPNEGPGQFNEKNGLEPRPIWCTTLEGAAPPAENLSGGLAVAVESIPEPVIA